MTEVIHTHAASACAHSGAWPGMKTRSDSHELREGGSAGTGQMGAGIAQVAAAAGHTVLVADVSREVAEKARAGIARRLGAAVEKGKMDRATADAVLGRLHPVGSVAEFKDVSIAIEAVAENVELKLKLFRELDAAAPPDAILAS